jgi:hypothetical protein
MHEQGRRHNQGCCENQAKMFREQLCTYCRSIGPKRCSCEQRYFQLAALNRQESNPKRRDYGEVTLVSYLSRERITAYNEP